MKYMIVVWFMLKGSWFIDETKLVDFCNTAYNPPWSAAVTLKDGVRTATCVKIPSPTE